MSDKEAAALAAAVTATLVHGAYYDCFGKVWVNSDVRQGVKTHPVSPTEEAYLREKAVITETLRGKEFTVCRFEFSNDEEEVPTTRKTRQRVAVAAEPAE